MDTNQKRRRRFSVAFKKEKVKMIEDGQISVLQLSRIYDVSDTAIYKWKKKFGKMAADEWVVVQKESEGKVTQSLHKKIADLEGALGRETLEKTYLMLVVELASEHYGEDIKKKFSQR